MMLFVILPLTTIPVVSAETLQDLAIESATSPRVDAHYDRWDAIEPVAMVRSDAAVQIDNRDIDVELCPGNHTASAECPSNITNPWKRTLSLSNVVAGSTVEADYSGSQYVPLQPGVHTAVFSFTKSDLDPSDDVLTYLFHIDDPLRDVVFERTEWDEESIRNSGVPYPVPVVIQSRNWLPDAPVEIGWSLYKEDAEVGRSAICFYIGLGTADDPDVPVDNAPPRLAIIGTGEAFNRTIEFSSPDLNPGSSYELTWTVTLNGTVNETWSGNHSWQDSNATLAHAFLMENLSDGEWCIDARMTDSLLFAGADSNTFLISVSNGESTVTLPSVTPPSEGTFRLQAGILDAQSDPNDWNDAGAAVTMIVDDSLDLWIKDIKPARGDVVLVEHQGQWLTLFPFGERSIEVVVGNIGYLPVNTTVSIEALDIITQGLVFGPELCEVSIAPGQEESCVYDFPQFGQFSLNASIDSTVSAIDETPSDNWFNTDISVNQSVVAPYISSPVEGQVFDSADLIELVAGFSQMAAAPLTFEWKLNYEESLGDGQVTNTTLPMGNWLLTCFVTDANNNTEIATRTVHILNRVQLTAPPYIYSGEAISLQGMGFNFVEPDYPPAGVVHAKAVNRGLSPLRSIGFEFPPTEQGEVIEMSYFEVWGNMSMILPQSVPRTSVQILRIQEAATGLLADLDSSTDSFDIYSNDTFYLRIGARTGGGYMFIGSLNVTEVNPANLHTEQRAGGTLTVKWNPEGDLENPYLGGWRVFKKNQFPFRWPYLSASDFQQTVEPYAVADLPALSTGWADPTPLTSDVCVSYVVVAFDIQGIADYTHGNVTGWQALSNPDLQCGDAVSPALTVERFQADVSFDPVSNLHTVQMTWRWPEYSTIEDNVSWALYRSQNLPESVRYLDPIVTNLWGEPGTDESYSETESPSIHSIKLGQQYHYILIATDDVGNSDYLIRDDNTVSVLVIDQFWDNHPELIPEVPEEFRYDEDEWMNQFQKDIRDPHFQQASIFAIVLIVINLIGIPLIINRSRFANRRIKAFSKSLAERRRTTEFADEIDDMFD